MGGYRHQTGSDAQAQVIAHIKLFQVRVYVGFGYLQTIVANTQQNCQVAVAAVVVAAVFYILLG